MTWQQWKRKMKKNDKVLEGYLKRLQRLESEINEDSDGGELINELNKIVDDLTQETQVGIIKNSINAKLKFVNKSDNPDPTFAEEGDSGFDLRAFIPFPVLIPPGKVKTIPTGLYFEVEKGLEVQVRPRSGLAKNKQVTVLNTPGTVDSKYRGEVQIILANFGEFQLNVENGDRIAQGVVCPVYGEGKLEMIKVDELSKTKRADGGFGHTGIK